MEASDWRITRRQQTDGDQIVAPPRGEEQHQGADKNREIAIWSSVREAKTLMWSGQ
jgi:hypothetical protein